MGSEPVKVAAKGYERKQSKLEHRSERVRFCSDEPLSVDEVGFAATPTCATASLFPTPSPSPMCPNASWDLCGQTWEARCQSLGLLTAPFAHSGALDEVEQPQEQGRRTRFCSDEPLSVEEVDVAMVTGSPLGFPLPTPTPFPQYHHSLANLDTKPWAIKVSVA